MKRAIVLMLLATSVMCCQAQVSVKNMKHKPPPVKAEIQQKPRPVLSDTLNVVYDTVKVVFVLKGFDGDEHAKYQPLVYTNGYLVRQWIVYQTLSQPQQGKQFAYYKDWTAIKPDDLMPGLASPFNWK